MVLAVIELGITLACKERAPKPSGQGEARAAAKATQSALQMTVTTDPQQPQDGKEFAIRVHVTDPAGKPVDDAQLHGVLVMKTMDMGKNEFDLAAKGNGDYEGKATPSMAGPWDVKVTAKRGADVTEQSSEVTVKE